MILPLQSELLTIAPAALEPLRSSPGERRSKVLVISCIFFRDANYCNLVFFQTLLEGRDSSFFKKNLCANDFIFFWIFFFLKYQVLRLKVEAQQS